MKIALRIAGIVALLLLMAKPSIYRYWERSVARSQFLLFKNVAMLFLATLWYLDASRKYFESSVAAVILLSVTACGQLDRELASMTGSASKTCIDGVTYLQFTNGATVQVDQTGKPVACK